MRGSTLKISKKVVRMGIDLGKHTFYVFGVDESGSTVVKKKRRRKLWPEYFANPPRLGGYGGLRRKSPLGTKEEIKDVDPSAPGDKQ
jgi:hypothetical protein